MIVTKKRHDPLGCTAPESIMSEEHIPDLCLGKSIDIFAWIDTLSHRIAIDMTRKGRLYDDAMDSLVCGESSYFIFEVYLGDSAIELIDTESHPDFTSTLLLGADIGKRCRILSYEYDREHRFISTCGRVSDLIFDIFEDGRGDEGSGEDHSRGD